MSRRKPKISEDSVVDDLTPHLDASLGDDITVTKQLPLAFVVSRNRKHYTCITEDNIVCTIPIPDATNLSKLQIGDLLAFKSCVTRSFTQSTTSLIARNKVSPDDLPSHQRAPRLLGKLIQFDYKEGFGQVVVSALNQVVIITSAKCPAKCLVPPQTKCNICWQHFVGVGSTFLFTPNFIKSSLAPLLDIERNAVVHLVDPSSEPSIKDSLSQYVIDPRFDFIGHEVLSFVQKNNGVNVDFSIDRPLSNLPLVGGKAFIDKIARRTKSSINEVSYDDLSLYATKRKFYSDKAKELKGSNTPGALQSRFQKDNISFYNPTLNHMVEFASFIEKTIQVVRPRGDRFQAVVAISLDSNTNPHNMMSIQEHPFFDRERFDCISSYTILTNNIINTQYNGTTTNLEPVIAKLGRSTILVEFDSSLTSHLHPRPTTESLPRHKGKALLASPSPSKSTSFALQKVMDTKEDGTNNSSDYLVYLHKNDPRKALLQGKKIGILKSPKGFKGYIGWRLRFDDTAEAKEFEALNKQASKTTKPLMICNLKEFNNHTCRNNVYNITTTHTTAIYKLYKHTACDWLCYVSENQYRLKTSQKLESIIRVLYAINRAVTKSNNRKANMYDHKQIVNTYKSIRNDLGDQAILTAGRHHKIPRISKLSVPYTSHPPEEQQPLPPGLTWFKLNAPPSVADEDIVTYLKQNFKHSNPPRVLRTAHSLTVWISTTSKAEIDRLAGTQVLIHQKFTLICNTCLTTPKLEECTTINHLTPRAPLDIKQMATENDEEPYHFPVALKIIQKEYSVPKEPHTLARVIGCAPPPLMQRSKLVPTDLFNRFEGLASHEEDNEDDLEALTLEQQSDVCQGLVDEVDDAELAHAEQRNSESKHATAANTSALEAKTEDQEALNRDHLIHHVSLNLSCSTKVAKAFTEKHGPGVDRIENAINLHLASLTEGKVPNQPGTPSKPKVTADRESSPEKNRSSITLRTPVKPSQVITLQKSFSRPDPRGNRGAQI